MVALTPRTHIGRHHSDHGHWEMVFREPDARLRAHVHGYQGYVESTTRLIRRREIPSGDVVLIVSFGAALRLIDPRGRTGSTEYRNFVAGLHDSYALTESTGASHGVQVNFTPIGAHLFLGLPMDTLTNRVTELEDLCGTMPRRLAAQLHEAPSWETRFRILDSVIGARLAEARVPSAGVAWAWHKLHETGGRLNIGTLATELGWSRKHLIAQFHEQIGLPPKVLARVLRFNRVIRLLDRDDEMSWVEIAQHCGYYDQAHLIKDFRQFAGSTPGEFLRRPPDGGGGVGD